MQLASAVGAGAVVAAAQTVSKRQLRKQRRRTMRWATVQQIVARCSVHKWGQQMEQEGASCEGVGGCSSLCGYYIAKKGVVEASR